MLKNPEYVKIDDKKYKINTSYKVALECNLIATDETIGDYERALAIIYKLFGESGLRDSNNHTKLLELGQKYLAIGKDMTEIKKELKNEPDFDYFQDWDYIKASFMSDYHIDLDEKEDMHWWTFFNLLNGLSSSEMGNCCILNKIRYIRSYDLSQEKDSKQRVKMQKLKQQFALKKKEEKLTEQEEENVNTFLKLVGMK